MALIKKNFASRLWARLCDYSLCFLLLGAISLFLPFFYDPLFYCTLALMVPVIWIPIEALLMFKWGATPGRRLFGIVIDRPLSWRQSIRSAFGLDRDSVFRFQPFSWKRKGIAVGVTLLCVGMSFFGNMLTQWGTGIERGLAVDGWVRFESEKAGFKISFPTDPQQESKQIVLPNTGKVLDYEEVTSHEKEKVLYSVDYMNVPRKWKLAGNATLMKMSLDAIVKHSKDTELLEKQFVMHQETRALDFKLKQEGKIVEGRLIIVGPTLYKLTIIYPPKYASHVKSNPFLDSFDISSAQK